MDKLPNYYYAPITGDQATKKSTFSAIASPATAAILAAKAGYRIAVFHVFGSGAAASTVVFSSAATAISPVIQFAANGNAEIGSPDNNMPLFVTNVGEALNATGVGSAAQSVGIIYAYIK